jgi:hypothetical protein
MGTAGIGTEKSWSIEANITESWGGRHRVSVGEMTGPCGIKLKLSERFRSRRVRTYLEFVVGSITDSVVRSVVRQQVIVRFGSWMGERSGGRQFRRGKSGDNLSRGTPW